MWSCGCILGELYSRRPLFAIDKQIGQDKFGVFHKDIVEKMFALLGDPRKYADAFKGCVFWKEAEKAAYGK